MKYYNFADFMNPFGNTPLQYEAFRKWWTENELNKNKKIMKITEETKIKEIIPEGWEIKDVGLDFNIDANVFEFISIPVKRKSKTLEDYEKELNNLSDRIISKAFFSILKDDYPKQYYSIILQMIADDICDKKIPKTSYIYKDNLLQEGQNIKFAESVEYITLGNIYFDTEEHAKQAVEIMGDKLKLLI